MFPRVLVIAVSVVIGCTSYDPDLSATPFYCGTDDPKCPDGYTCMAASGGGSAVCTSGTAPLTDAMPSGTCTMAHSGVLATWDFTGATGSQASTAASSPAPGVTAGNIMRATTLMAATGSGSINSSNWATGAQLDATKYYTLSITPPTGCSLSLSSISIDVTSSGTGPTTASVATSADAFAQTSSVSTTAPSTPSLSVSGHAGAVEIRIYGYGATSTGGTMRAQNMLTVTGATQ